MPGSKRRRTANSKPFACTGANQDLIHIPDLELLGGSVPGHQNVLALWSNLRRPIPMGVYTRARRLAWAVFAARGRGERAAIEASCTSHHQRADRHCIGGNYEETYQPMLRVERTLCLRRHWGSRIAGAIALDRRCRLSATLGHSTAPAGLLS
jgi:hypothetical protein